MCALFVLSDLQHVFTCHPNVSAGEMLSVAEPFLEQQMHPTTIIAAYRQALDDIVSITKDKIRFEFECDVYLYYYYYVLYVCVLLTCSTM